MIFVDKRISKEANLNLIENYLVITNNNFDISCTIIFFIAMRFRIIKVTNISKSTKRKKRKR
jgi:hypothetical protein